MFVYITVYYLFVQLKEFTSKTLQTLFKRKPPKQRKEGQPPKNYLNGLQRTRNKRNKQGNKVFVS